MAQSEILRFLLQGDARALNSALDEANSRLDGAKDAAERAAIAIELLTEAAETRMRGAAQATEALSTALGQETVAAIERAGGSVDGWVADLNRAGVAYDEIAAKADRFAGVIRNAESVAGNLDRVNDSAVRQVTGSSASLDPVTRPARCWRTWSETRSRTSASSAVSPVRQA
jgi:ABC-type transporter Mla subunit MlaD